MVGVLTLEGLEQTWKCGDLLCEHEGRGHDDTSEAKENPGFLADYQKTAERTGKKRAESVLRIKVEGILKRQMPQTMERLHNQRQSAVT